MKSKQRNRFVRKNKGKQERKKTKRKVYRGGKTDTEDDDIDGFTPLFLNNGRLDLTPAVDYRESDSGSGIGSKSALLTTSLVVLGAGTLLTILLMKR